MFGIFLPIIIITSAIFYREWNEKHNKLFIGCDKPNYTSVLSASWNICDFYSDLIFVVTLYIDDNFLFIYGLIFSIIPHLLSNIISLYCIKNWQLYKIYICKCINHYDWLINTLSVLSGFYTQLKLHDQIYFI